MPVPAGSASAALLRDPASSDASPFADRNALIEGLWSPGAIAYRSDGLHPNLSEVYRARVARLREGIEAQGDREVLEAARALIARVEVHPPTEPGARPRLELLGELSAMLAAAGVEGAGTTTKIPPTVAGGLDVFCGSVSVDAGTRRQRSQYITVCI